MNKWIKYTFLTITFLASSWALFFPGFFRVHDFTHAARIVEMTQALKEGHFPVRWTQDFGYGYGMPLFEFYAPLPFYLGSFFYSLGLDVVLVIKILFALCSVGVMIGAYKLANELFNDERSAVLVAAATTLAPYRSVNLYVRGALSEAWAITFIPWILLGLVLLIKKSPRAWLVMTLSTTGLMLSHNLTTMIFLPISLVFFSSLILIELASKRMELVTAAKIIFKAVGSYTLAIGLAAFYLLPAFLEKDFTKVDQSVINDYFNFNLHFLYIRQFLVASWGYGGSAWGVDDGISFFLGWGQLAALLAFPIYLLIKGYKLQKKKFGKQDFIAVFGIKLSPELIRSVVFLGLLCFSLFMSLLKSQAIWQQIPLFKYIQFPWRWLSVSLVFLGLLQPYLLEVFEKEKIKKAVFYLLLIGSLANVIFFKPETFLSDPSGFYYTDRALIRRQMSDILQDYIPIAMSPVNQIEPVYQLVLSVDKEPQQYQVAIDQSHQKLIQTNFSNTTTLNLGLASFPGWKAELDGEEIELKTSPDGNYQLDVPKGSHLVGIIFGSTLLRSVADTISAISLIILVWFNLPSLINQKKIIHD
ncbi:MAG: hypothetical protein ACOZAN_00200 [Patescibacteria group bacterium]